MWVFAVLVPQRTPMAHGPWPIVQNQLHMYEFVYPVPSRFEYPWVPGTLRTGCWVHILLRTIEKVINNLALTWRVFAVYVTFMGESARVYEDVSAALRPA